VGNGCFGWRQFYRKIHVAVDIKTKQAVSLEVSNDKTHDGEKLVLLIEKARRKVKVKRVLGDGGYDNHDNFKFLAACGIEAADPGRRGFQSQLWWGQRGGSASLP